VIPGHAAEPRRKCRIEAIAVTRRRAYTHLAIREAFQMQTLLYHATTVATLAVLAVLLAGLWNMTRGKSPNLSQKLMRWRVGLQFCAILIIIAYALVAH